MFPKNLRNLILWNLETPHSVAIKLFDKYQLRKLALLTGLQGLVGLLDLTSLLVLSFIVSKGISNLSTSYQSETPSTLSLERIGTSLSIELNLILLLTVFVSLSLIKTIVAPLAGMHLLRFLSVQSSKIAAKYLNVFTKRNFSRIRFGSSQNNLSAIGSSMDWLVIGYIGSLSMLISESLVLLCIFCGLLYVDWITTLILFGLIALVGYVIGATLNKKSFNWSKELTELNSTYSRRVLDRWLVYREICLRGKDQFSSNINQMRNAMAQNRAKLTILPNMIKYIFEGLIVVIALVTASVQYFFSTLDQAIVTFIVIVVALSKILPSVLRFQTNLLSARQYYGLGTHAIELINENFESATNYADLVFEEESSNRSTYSRSRRLDGAIKVKDVSYTYPDSRIPIIKSLSFSIDKNQKFAIVGPSGSGKSTLVDLILGFLSPQQGSIEISGLTPERAILEWPGCIAYVPQDVYVFEGTILENVTLGTESDANFDSLENAIFIAGLSEEISSLPNGVRTHVGERGFRLSGGQRQRLGIARALYGNPSILVLDEATSSLDATKERQISLAMDGSLAEVTIVIVAHRLSTIRSADSILYLEDGCIRGIGTFDELVKEIPNFEMQVINSTRISP